jgi:hypothetical protein
VNISDPRVPLRSTAPSPEERLFPTLTTAQITRIVWPGGADTPPLESLVARVRGEYCEMPGLRLTFAQACRLWQVDVSTCEALLDQLVREGFLCKTNNGFFIAAAITRRRV